MIALLRDEKVISLNRKKFLDCGQNNEWYTPHRYIEAAREVMGSIELDPASCELANRIIKAERYYTAEENGLAQAWNARSLWLNPPYGRTHNKSNIGLFTQRLLYEYKAGNVGQAILLSTPRPDTPWFPSLWDYPICFCEHGIAFYRLTGKGDIEIDNRHTGHFFGTIFVYLGPHEQKFIEVFSRFGHIARAIDPPQEAIVPLSLWEEPA